ncbi:MAG: ADP-ribosylglycohydrolase family protein [Verrucomicrobiales bacterium]
MSNLLSRYQGSLLGLAVGDALGTTVEFKPPGSFEPLTTIVGGGPFSLPAGAWTDDTSMALCLATSLVECGGFNADDQMKRYVKWWREGYLSSTGSCFDIGNTVQSSLRKYQETGNPFSGSTAAMSAGNGSLMRLAPIPLFYFSKPEEAIYRAAESSRTTHGAVACMDACRYYTALMVGALQGVEKDDLLNPAWPIVAKLKQTFCPEIQEVAGGSFRRRQPPGIRGSGYVVQALEAALWAFASASDFEAGALRAVNLGDDADTTGAIYGQLAGAYFGGDGIPAAWLQVLMQKDLIKQIATDLFQHAAAMHV